jgi:hypothetical protein
MRGAHPRAIESFEGLALRLGERSMCEAGYEGVIGRTLAEEEELAVAGNRPRFADARQALRSRAPLKKKQRQHGPSVGVGRLPSNPQGFHAVP